MINSSKWTFIFLALGTILLLTYVHAQVLVYKISYSIEAKERRLAKLKDEHKISKFQVARLKSPEFLSRKLKDSSLDLVIPRHREVIRLIRPTIISERTESVGPIRFPLMGWLHFIKEAQAKTSK